MTEVRTRRSPRLLPWAVDSVLLAGLLLGAIGPSGISLVAGARADASVQPSTKTPAISLAVDPSSFWMRTGSNVTLVAVWTAVAPPCRLVPLWYRWSSTNGTVTGFLNDSEGPSVTFFADSFRSATSNVTVRSLAVRTCDGNETVLERTAVATISVETPLIVSGLELSPNPLLPEENATMTGNVVGGEPPYSLEMTWGDGTYSFLNRSVPGAFTANHQFPSGEFLPSVLVSDSAGGVVNASLAEAVSVGTGLEVAIAPRSFVADVGVPVEFVGVVSDPSAPEVPLFDCSNATTGGSSTPTNSSAEVEFSCTFNTPGTQEVLFGVYPTQPGGPSASVVLYEQVVEPPTVSAEAVQGSEVVDGSSEVRVQVSGGAPPISLAWNISGNQSGGSEVLASDGAGTVTFSLAAAGEYTFTVRATDGFGEVAHGFSSANQVAEAPLAANANGTSELRSGAFVGVGGEVVSGCAPFFWWVVPEFAPSNGSLGNGTLPNAGAFIWNASFEREGNLSIVVGIVDACGSVWQTVLVVPLVVPLSVSVSVNPGPALLDQTLAVNLSVDGGAPPFRFEMEANDNESWIRTLASDGSYHWLIPSNGTGLIGLSVSVVDLLGQSATFSTTVHLTPRSNSSAPPSAPPPTTLPSPSGNSTAEPPNDSTWLLALVLIPIVGATFLILLRRRRAKEATQVGPLPDPVATLKRIVQPAEGAERFTVELLAEEAGIPMTVVRSTIDRLVQEGKLHSESGADGEEVLSWASDGGQ